MVNVGDKGDVVKEIQQLLIDLGFSVGSKGDDGKFGPDTKKGVMDFQSDNNIKVDGIVGPITAKKNVGYNKNLTPKNLKTLI